jgi:hypothetical protein
MERTMLMTLLVALGALLLRVVGRSTLDPHKRDTDHRELPICEKAALSAL